ncbi:unnamed protein product, partial [Iphiclides podalirius]
MDSFSDFGVVGGIGNGMEGSGCVIPSSYPHSSSPPYSGEASDSGDITIAGGRPKADDEVTSDELSSSIRSEWKPPLLDQRRLMSMSALHAPQTSIDDGHPLSALRIIQPSREGSVLVEAGFDMAHVRARPGRQRRRVLLDVQANKKVAAAEWSAEAQLRPRSPGYQTRVGDAS